jgi:magnesium transporter
MDPDEVTHSFTTGCITSAIPDGQDAAQHHSDARYDEDIYRGGLQPIQVPEEHAVDEVSISGASISSSTSASAHLVRRALATIVELAILRWARSSSPNDSDSSLSSIQHPRQGDTHRPRISTTADTAHIALSRKTAERARRVTREFQLVLPVFQPQDRSESLYRVLQTSSHTLALAQLSLTLRQAHRARKDAVPRDSRSPIQLNTLRSPLANTPDPESSIGASGLQTETSMNKIRPHTRSKQTQSILRPSIGIAPWQAGKSVGWKKAWWLDVASPTWDDMRAIGTVSLKLFRESS